MNCYVARVMPCNGNGHIETLMLMEWYIALFTCKTTAHSVFSCRRYLDVGTGGGAPGTRCYVHSMYTTKINCAPQSTSPLCMLHKRAEYIYEDAF